MAGLLGVWFGTYLVMCNWFWHKSDKRVYLILANYYFSPVQPILNAYEHQPLV